MARVTSVKKAQQRFKTVPVLDSAGQPLTIPVLRRDGSPKKTKSGREITRRLTVEDRNHPLPNRKCDKCGKEIKPGDPYKWTKPKSGPYGGSMRVRCAACPTWRPSETTSSPALGTLYAAQEAFDDALANVESVDDIRSALEELAEGVREAGQVYEESADNMEQGFGHETSLSEELKEKAEALSSAADEIENADLEDWDEDEARSEVVRSSSYEGREPDEYDWDDDPEDLQGEVDQRMQDHLDAQIEAATEKADEANNF